MAVYDSFIPAVKKPEGVGVEERQSSGNKGRIVQEQRSAPHGCQENKVLVKPIRDGPELILALDWRGMAHIRAPFIGQLLKRWFGCRHSNFVKK